MAEQPEATPQVTPTNPTPAATAPAASPLIDQYEYDEPSEVPSEPLPGSQPPAAAPTHTDPPAATSQERDPATGRFIARQNHSQRVGPPMAADLGIEQDVIDTTPPDLLDEIVYRTNKEVMRLARERSRNDAVENSLERPIEPAAAKPPVVDPEDAFGLENEADYDPKLVAVVKRLHQSSRESAKEIKDLKEQLAQVNQREQVRQNETVAEQIDRVFSKHEAHLGKGRGRDLLPDSRDYIRRTAVLSIVDRDQSKASLEQKIDRAVASLYGVSNDQPSPKPTNGAAPAAGRITPEDWQQAGLARPTQRTPPPEPKGVKKATRAVEEAMREMGTDQEPTVAEDFLE